MSILSKQIDILLNDEFSTMSYHEVTPYLITELCNCPINKKNIETILNDELSICAFYEVQLVGLVDSIFELKSKHEKLIV